jgi:VPDSG-CTERM motif
MKNRSSKTILVFFALGLISCALCVQQAQAVPITGAITFAGGVELDTGTVNTASQVTGWLDENGALPTVQSVSGSFAGLAGFTATFAFPWSFSSGPIAAFWTVGGFTFNLIGSSIVSQIGDGFLAVSGTGIITGPAGFGPTAGTWSFTAQDDPSNGVFSFSGSTEATPDGGATVALLGLALAGIEGIRRKLRRAKS